MKIIRNNINQEGIFDWFKGKSNKLTDDAKNINADSLFQRCNSLKQNISNIKSNIDVILPNKTSAFIYGLTFEKENTKFLHTMIENYKFLVKAATTNMSFKQIINGLKSITNDLTNNEFKNKAKEIERLPATHKTDDYVEEEIYKITGLSALVPVKDNTLGKCYLSLMGGEYTALDTYDFIYTDLEYAQRVHSDILELEPNYFVNKKVSINPNELYKDLNSLVSIYKMLPLPKTIKITNKVADKYESQGFDQMDADRFQDTMSSGLMMYNDIGMFLNSILTILEEASSISTNNESCGCEDLTILDDQVEVYLNPIEEDQALEIANNTPDTDDLKELTSYEQVNKIATDIDNNVDQIDHPFEINKKLKELKENTNPSLDTIIAYNKEALKLLWRRYDLKPLTLSKEDINQNPVEAYNVIESELQVIQDKANETTWATIKEDTNNIVKLIDATLDTIKSKESLKVEALEALDKGRLTNSTIELNQVIPIIGSLRYFINENDGEGSLEELLEVMKNIANEASPKLTSDDNTIFAKLSKNDISTLTAAKEHIMNSITTDSLNTYLRNKIRNKPKYTEYTLYGKVTGNNKVKVLSNGVCKEETVEETYFKFKADSSTFNSDEFRNSLVETIANFENRFKNLFLLYKKKYETLHELIKPIALDIESELDRTKQELMSETLRLIKYYYIGFVKNRIVDKLNVYLTLLETIIITYDTSKLSTKE